MAETHTPHANGSASSSTPHDPIDYGLSELAEKDIETLEKVSRDLMQAALKGQQLFSDVVYKSLEGHETPLPPLDSFKATPEMAQVWEKILADPELMMQSQSDLFKGYIDLWANTTKSLMAGQASPPVIEADKSDKRWRSEDWSDNPVFSAIKQSYLLNQRFMLGLVAGAKNVDDITKRKVTFVTKQMIDALSPTNFAMTNPDVLRETFQSKGENLTRGLMNLVSDLERGSGRLALTQTDLDGFTVGKDLATTPGKVIYRNRVMELIQYAPRTEQVRQRPLLIVPPWINKFYILDMRQKNSMIHWLTGQGFTVFLISWVNPDASMKDVSFEDYMREGLFEALDSVEKATGEKAVDTVGYCIGGTLLGTSLAYMAKTKDKRIASATFFAAQLDFAEAGELLMFVDDAWMKEIERLMDLQGGVLDGRTMADTFNLLRANDLVWSFVVNNYLLGRQPQAFDLLYWNADQTRMPKALHLFYLDNFYRKNRLSKGELVLGDQALDLKNVKIPVYMQAAREDHIAPYPSVYRSAKLFGGLVTYTLAGSGHIAGVVNHPGANKYQHWTHGDLESSVETWIDKAEEHPGSWWPHWRDWLYQLSGDEVPALEPGQGKLKALCDAPGEYVKVRS